MVTMRRKIERDNAKNNPGWSKIVADGRKIVAMVRRFDRSPVSSVEATDAHRDGSRHRLNTSTSNVPFGTSKSNVRNRNVASGRGQKISARIFAALSGRSATSPPGAKTIPTDHPRTNPREENLMNMHATAIEAAIDAAQGSLTDADEPLVALLRTLAERMDAAASDGPSGRLVTAYVTALRMFDRRTGSGGSPSTVAGGKLAQLRTRHGRAAS